MGLQRVMPIPGGGKAYSYGSYTQYVPPVNFNPLKASDKQLSEYGMPTRKQLGRQWYGVMSHFRYAAKPTPYLAENPNDRSLPAHSPAAGPVACTQVDCNSHWSGYVATSETYDEVSSAWTEPSFSSPPTCSGGAFVQWVGIGGWTSNYLGQDGTSYNVPGFTAHQAFIETINNDNSPMVPVALSATPGQQFWASTLWDPQLSEFFYYMENYYTGASYSASSRPVTADTSAVEVISERPTISGSLPPLANYGQIPVAAEGYYGSTAAPFSSLPITNVAMEDNSNSVMSFASSPISSGLPNWTDYWVACS